MAFGGSFLGGIRPVTVWDVNLVTAFGRGEALARALRNGGFSIRVLDFTDALLAKSEASGQKLLPTSTGPFPILLGDYLSTHKEWLGDADELSRGLSFWLEKGPLEMGGSMAPYYRETRPEVKAFYSGSGHREFEQDWLRRFLLQWASPQHFDSWNPASFQTKSFLAVDSNEPLRLGIIPPHAEAKAMSLQRFEAQGRDVVKCSSLRDLSVEHSRITHISIDSETGSENTFRASHWVWCLSSQETHELNEEVAAELFPRGVWQAQWSWVRFNASCGHGPWLDGLPEHVIVIDDLFLPWAYANALVLHKLAGDNFALWLKVPNKNVRDTKLVETWAREAQQILNKRLSLAKWAVDPRTFGKCPHSIVFDTHKAEYAGAAWKNWDWIAPERLPRLDFAARFEREAQCFQRLLQWRNDQLKKQGVSSDPAIHAP